MKKRYLVTSITIMSLCLLFTATTYAKPYYQGKTLTIIVPHNPGGGTDIFARLVAKYISKYIPGQPTVIVRNLLGAMGIAGSNYVYNVAKRDGLTGYVGSGYTAMHSLLRTKGTKFSYDDMPAVMVGATGEVIYTRCKQCPKPEDIVKVGKNLVFGYVPMPASITISFMLAKELLGFETKKDVLAFDASSDSRRAFLAGESDILGESTIGYAKAVAPLAKEGKVCPVWQSGIYDIEGNLVRETGAIADVPTIEELYVRIHGKKPSGPVWDAMAAYIAYNRTICKVFLFPPGTEKYAAIVREAGVKMAQDPKFQKDAAKIFLGSPIYTGKDALRIIEDSTARAKKIRSWLREWTYKGWGVEFEK